MYTLHTDFLPARPITDRHQQSPLHTQNRFETRENRWTAKDITQHAVLIFVVLFKLDFSCFFYGLDSVSERRSLDPRTKRSNGSFIRTWKKEQRERELKSTSRWQWIQDRKLLHRQFNFTQRNHNFFILFDFHFVFFIMFCYHLVTITIFLYLLIVATSEIQFSYDSIEGGS